MQSYKKLAKQRDEAIFYIKTALKSRQIHMKEEDADLQNLRNALTLDELLDNLTKLYEIE